MNSYQLLVRLFKEQCTVVEQDAQIAETYSDKDDNRFSLITYVSEEPAHQSDSNALAPVIQDTQKRGLGPKKVLADTPYGSDENREKAKKLGVYQNPTIL